MSGGDFNWLVFPEADGNDEHEYRFKGVVLHSGQFAFRGHYTSRVMSPLGQLYAFDDNKIRALYSTELRARGELRQVYIAFYEHSRLGDSESRAVHIDAQDRNAKSVVNADEDLIADFLSIVEAARNAWLTARDRPSCTEPPDSPAQTPNSCWRGRDPQNMQQHYSKQHHKP